MTKANVIGGLVAVVFVAVAACVILRSGATHAPAIPAAVGLPGEETGQTDGGATRVTHHPIVVMPGDLLDGAPGSPYSPSHAANWPQSPAGRPDDPSLRQGRLSRPSFMPDPSRLEAVPHGIELSPAIEWPEGRRSAPVGMGENPMEPARPLPFRAEGERHASPASLPRFSPR